MKKRLSVEFLAMFMCLPMLILAGCGTRKLVSDQNYENKTEQTKAYTTNVYYVDEQTAEIVGKNVTVSDEYDIWRALQETGILTKECKLLSLKVNEEQNTLDLDFNSATGDYIRTMGTTGETEIIGCIINTYLEAYDGSGIKLTEEGHTLETSHGADMSGYNSKMSF